MSRYRWTILAVGVAAQTAYAAASQSVAVLSPALQDRYNLSLPQLGVALAALWVGSGVSLLPWGLLADRVGERPVLATGLAVSAAALVGAAYAKSFATFLAALVVGGMFGSSVIAASGRAVMGWFAYGERGFALGVRQTSVPLGGFLAAVALPQLGPHRGFLALAGAAAAAALVGGLWLRDAPAGTIEEQPGGPHPLRDRRVWRVAVGSAVLVCTQTGVASFVVLFLHETRGLSPGAAAGVLAAINAGGMVVRIAFGRASDRLGRRIGPLRAVSLGMTVSTAVAAALVHAPLAALVPAFVLAGTLSAGWNGLSFTAAAELAGRRRSGAALGIQQTALTVASVITPLVFAPLVEATSWQVGFAVLAGVPLAAFALFAPLARAEPVPRLSGAATRGR